MCAAIVAIEFDQHVFGSEVKCEQWLRSKPEYQHLVQSKKWRLKTVARSIWMSSEGRKVFAWHGPIFQCRDIHLVRPDPYVLIITREGSSFFYETDYPALSARALNRIRTVEAKQEARDQARLERKEKAKAKKRKSSTLKRGKSPFDPTDAKALKRAPLKRRSHKKIKKEVIEIPDLPNFDPSTVPILPALDSDFTTRVDVS